ncbi:MAG: hypothetical protein ACRDPW_07555 [Mycobacteriales bacterium]
MSLSPSRRFATAVLGTAVLTALVTGGTILTGPAIANAGAEQTSQPYYHLLTPSESPEELNTGGTYVSNGGDVSLTLTGNSNNVDVDILLEECEGPDLSKSIHMFAGDSKAHVLASDVEEGTCFIMLLRPSDAQATRLAGTLTY